MIAVDISAEKLDAFAADLRGAAAEIVTVAIRRVNIGQNADEQKKAITERRAALTKANPNATGPIPDDALTASGSGVDPDISVAYARWQAPRIAAARGMSVADVEKVIDAHIEKPALGYLGAERVNVLDLNIALAQRAAR